MPKYTFPTSLPPTKDITPGLVIAATSAGEINLTGTLDFRAKRIAFDVFIKENGRINGPILENGHLTLASDQKTEIIDGGIPWLEHATSKERDIIGQFLLGLRDFVRTHENTHGHN
jgi:hypothetical protein